MPSVYATPDLRDDELGVLKLIDGLRADLSHRVAEPRRWTGSLRKMSFARAVQGSNSIEGYDAALDDVVAAVDDEPTLDADEETRLALQGYRDAMTYVLQIADDEDVDVDQGLLKSLHFMMLKHDLPKNPGRWRPGHIQIRRDETGELVYDGPEREGVPELITETLAELDRGDAPVLVRAAMAHLNLVLVHPFSDGNGRMARCLQTLVLARDRLIAPVFSSIEEFLGRNTESYYDMLADVGGGSWHPERDARPWVRYCLRAHYHQIKTVLRRQEEIERIFIASQALAKEHGLAERTAAGILEAAHGFRLRRGSYKSIVQTVFAEEISDLTASRDLKAMVDAGLLEPVGERRGRYYVGGTQVKETRARARSDRPPKSADDPFLVVRDERQLKLS